LKIKAFFILFGRDNLMVPDDLCGIKKFDSIDSAKTELESLSKQFGVGLK
jgi:hypothetical protein